MADDTLGKWNERLRQARAERQKYEADWFMNLAFYQGRQWVAWDGRSIFEPRINPNRAKVTVNLVQPAIRTEVAKMAKQRPAWSTTPRSGDDSAVNDARTSQRLLDWAYDHLSVGSRRRLALQWSRICGAGFVKATWDPTVSGTGETVLIKPNGEPVMNPQNGRVLKLSDWPQGVDMPDGVQTQQMGQGDVCLYVRSPFDIFPDPLATELEDARWIIDESIRSPEYVKEKYGKDVNPDTRTQTGVVESRYMGAYLDQGSGDMLGVRVWEGWEPNGAHVVWTSQGVLYEEPNPYGCIPYFMFKGVVIPGRFWPDAITSQLRPINDRVNKLLSQIFDNAARFGNPSLLIDTLANVKYHGVPGEQIRFDGTTQNAAPAFLQPPSMPGYVFNLLEQFQAAVRDVSGQYDVNSASVPSGVTAASAISLLQEQDSTRLAPDVEDMEDVLAKIGQHALKLMAKHYSTERLVVIAGEDGIVDIDRFRASATFKVPDVAVQPGSTFPRSTAAKQAAMRDMLNMFFQYGVPLDQQALARALRDMQVGGLEALVQSFSADQEQIVREHTTLIQGKPLVGNALVDNHSAHIAGHKDFAKGARYQSLDPQLQQALMEHIKWHEQLAQPAPQLMPPGAPAPGGQPPITPSTVPTYPSGNPVATQGSPDQPPGQ